MSKVKIGTLINSLASKLGIDTNTQDFKDLLSTNLEIPQNLNDAIVSLVEGSVESAVKNPDVRKRLTAEVLSPIDKQLEKSLDKYGLSDDDIDDINSKTTTREKLKAFDQKMEAALKAAKEAQKPADPKDTAALEASIRTKLEKEYNDKVKKLNQDFETKVAEKDNAFVSQELDWSIERGILGKKLNFDEKIPASIQMRTVVSSYKEHLKEKGYKLTKDADGNIKLVKSDDTPVYNQKNEVYNPSDYLAAYLADNSLLDVRGNQPPKTTQQRKFTTDQVEAPEHEVNTDALEMLDASMEALGLAN